LPGLSLSIFRKNYPDSYKQISRLFRKEDEFIRSSFFAGRKEIYIPISDHSYHYDINSVYGYIMANNDFPVGFPIKVELSETFNLENFYGFCKVIVQVNPNGTLPVLPIKVDGEHTLYPTGIFKGTYFSEELKLAVEQGAVILKILEAYKFEKGQNLFKEYISTIYSFGINETNKDLKRTYKLLINGLYGRFSFTHEKETILVLDKKIIRAERKEYYNVAISSAISSLARIYVYKYIKPYQKNLLYWDTDEIFLNIKLPQEYLASDSSINGKFRIKSENLLTIFAALKFYLYTIKDSDAEETRYVFSGLNLKEYKEISFNYITSTLYKIIRDLCDNDTKFTTIELKFNKKDNSIYIFNTAFFNYRKLMRNNNSIFTVPWNLTRKLSCNNDNINLPIG